MLLRHNNIVSGPRSLVTYFAPLIPRYHHLFNARDYQ